MARPAVFLDRDGVLNVGVRGDYIRDVSQFRWLPGAREGIALLTRDDRPIVLVTNQSGIARGFFTEADLERIHRRMRADAEAAGGKIAAVYFCPHRDEDRCSCRKPLPGMLLQAARELDLDLKRSTLVGDSEIDMVAGRAAGCRVVAVTTGLTPGEEVHRWNPAPDRVCSTLMEAAEWINAHETDRC